MGGEDCPSEARSCPGQVSGFPEEGFRTLPRTPVMCDGSKEARLTRRVIGERLLHQSIQFAGSRVTLNLTIPFRPVLFHQPFAQLRELGRIELDDLLFKLFDASHDLSIIRRLRGQVLRPAILATTNA